MKTSNPALTGQRGFGIGIVLLVLALIAVLAGVIAASTRGATNTSAGADGGNASAIIFQASQLDIGFQRMASNGVAITTVTFDATANTGLFNATTGTTQTQTPPASAFATPPGPGWKYTKLVPLNTVGTAAADFSVYLTGVTKGVCEQINLKLHGATTVPASTSTTAAWAAGTANTLETAGGSDFCYSTDGATLFVYAHAVQEN